MKATAQKGPFANDDDDNDGGGGDSVSSFSATSLLPIHVHPSRTGVPKHLWTKDHLLCVFSLADHGILNEIRVFSEY
jgi:hypothetical protein